ncbi:MAG: helix-turn-helix transcriptional regulator [Chitinophagaceae bacterium]|nr:helix-turn-helix transcriptional regulator [Chitinophagaceae bacterium]
MRKTTSTNYTNEMVITAKCPITFTMLAIGGRWKLIIIWHLRLKALRYNELKKAIPNISEKMLIQQLKDLEKDNWIIKKNYHEIPPRTDYSLSKLGKSFIPILENIYTWGVKNKITEK